ncbi:MAG: 2-amino-4-hydroxy-6-hydroxymethyldihydropteridine diphosphokinase [Acidobacteria bacterium]|nr:2-amino-4-hydroxy-6-hydroxymethyldihydropteridine diphosphokinase [Acidobacteriota bacterium]
MTPVVIGLGSNLGDRREHLLWAAGRLAAMLSDVELSPIIETEPVGVPDVQPPYLNAVAVGFSGLAPGDLLDRLLRLERDRSRTRPGFRSPRTLDLDLILYGDLVIETPDLVVPHPRFRERAFVLEPLVAVAPDVRDPVTGRTAGELLARLQGK